MKAKTPPPVTKYPGPGRPPGVPNHDYGSAIDKMQRTPGKWYLVRTFDSTGSARSTVTRIRSGNTAPFRRGRWEVTSRGADLYARYLGE